MTTWTAALPSVEGAYWVKPKHGPTDLVKVVMDDTFNRLGIQTFGDGFIWSLDRMPSALWFGPLEPPAIAQAPNK